MLPGGVTGNRGCLDCARAVGGDQSLRHGRRLRRLGGPARPLDVEDPGRIFLATKTGERSASRAYDGIRRSLERLQADRVDLIQLHAIGDLEDLDAATGSCGAVEGAVRARGEGLVGAIGITGQA